jgi:hypothetical protein
MENLHLIPADKPSRLHLKSYGFYLTKEENSFIPYSYPQNIYITSDEEIKDGDWYISLEGKLLQFTGRNVLGDKFKAPKIILTTDQDLIKDGVQSIPDEFLEWFVKNPSCEFVEIKKSYSDFTVEPFVGYKIIIPQQEQAKKMYSEEDVRNLFNQYKEKFSLYRNIQILPAVFEEWFKQFKQQIT